MLVDRFWQYVIVGMDCWGWAGATTDWGYGVLRLDAPSRRMALAHRVSWELHNGPVPDGLWILHRCDNPPCANPAHLYPGSHDANMRDAKSRRRMQFGGERHNARLSAAKVHEIRVACAAGLSQAVLATRFGVSQPTISDVVTGRTWAHVR